MRGRERGEVERGVSEERGEGRIYGDRTDGNLDLRRKLKKDEGNIR